VREILLSVDELGDFARASQDGLPGRLRIGVIPTIVLYLLPTIVGDLSKLHPEIDIHMRETQTEKLIRELEHGLLDTAIVTGCETWAGFSVTTLKSRLVLCSERGAKEATMEAAQAWGHCDASTSP
jgi:LysR family hydrogen peroxide-inducible transcriptional activator